MQPLAPRRNLECSNGRFNTLDWNPHSTFFRECGAGIGGGGQGRARQAGAGGAPPPYQVGGGESGRGFHLARCIHHRLRQGVARRPTELFKKAVDVPCSCLRAFQQKHSECHVIGEAVCVTCSPGLRVGCVQVAGMVHDGVAFTKLGGRRGGGGGGGGSERRAPLMGNGGGGRSPKKGSKLSKDKGGGARRYASTVELLSPSPSF